MSKKLHVLILSFSLITAVFSSPVSKEKAAVIAKNFYAEKAFVFGHGTLSGTPEIKEIYTNSEDEINYYYVFTFSKKGFVIVAADDVLPPVLGYSLDGTYVNEDQPDSYRNFMQTYNDEIDYVIENNLQQTQEMKDKWDHYTAENFVIQEKSGGAKSIDPLVPCQWNQSYPYNYYCPEATGGSGGHVYAGCVATAMSQVMYYWRYPLQGSGSHSYYYPPYGNLSANFGATTYEWEGMQNSIDHDNIGPIALLQYHCGIAVDMMYGPSGSGAYSNDVPPALINYFNYSSDCYYSSKNDHSNSEWKSMLKADLDIQWPLYYSGFSSAGGHAFVCDGYQDDYFHFNFGWSGQSDGYYALTNVNGFSGGQGAVFDIHPGSDYPYFCTGDHVMTQLSGSFEEGSGPIENYPDNSNCSWLFTPQTLDDSISNITITFKSFETEANDKVRIYDGSTIEDNLLGEFSGSILPEEITTSGNQLLVTFESDGSGNAAGWLAEYTANRPEYCKGMVTFTAPEGSVSDGSGSFNYHNGSACLWKIIPEQAQTVTLHFTSFNTEENYDRVRIYDLETQEMITEYSGNYSGANLPGPVTSPSGKMFIAFSSNATNNAPGWDAYYTTVLTGINDNLADLGTVKIYPNPASDHITIELPDAQEETATIRMINAGGAQVYNNSLSLTAETNRLKVNTRDFPKGVYFVQITGMKATKTYKVVLQ